MSRIEDDVPLPAPSRGPTAKYAPLYEMAVGQSVLLEPGGYELDDFAARVSDIMSHILKTRGRRFTRRIVEGGVRVWRVE